jgi:hypothetical protein
MSMAGAQRRGSGEQQSAQQASIPCFHTHAADNQADHADPIKALALSVIGGMSRCANRRPSRMTS